uniref:Lipocalin n=1 Tax=Rhipicephalus zambeziensis TaxID=60191 RepID=A0A224YN63_9ACAR
MHETSETCPYYVRDFLNHTFYVFNLTTEERCEPKITRYSADLGNDTENTPYMNIHNWTGTSNLKKELRYYNSREKCAIFAYKESGPTQYELHIWSVKFLIWNGSKVFHGCFSVYQAYISQLSHLRYECIHGCS